MNIRAKLTLRFLVIVSLILIFASIVIYTFSADYRQDTFYSRLLSKAKSTAKLLLEVQEINAVLLKKIEKDNPTSLPYEKITVYNALNEILFTTDEENLLNPNSAFLDSIRHAGEIKYKKDDYEIAAFALAEQPGVVVIAGAIDIFGKRRLQFLRNTVLIVTGASLILVFISGWYFSGQALSPIKKVMNQVDNISISKLNLRVDEGNGTDEIARLAKTFNQMLERLELAFKVQKNFIGNASHELRTPLTAIIGQIEVNLLKERSAEEYKTALQSVLDDIKNLNSISNRLLLLAQTSSESGEPDFTPLRIDELLWQTKSELEKRNPDYRIHINMSTDFVDDSMLTVSGSEQLLKTAFINLADNGCKYSPDHQVWIKLHNNSSKKIIIDFIDKGIGISDSDLKQIFTPFFRGKNALTVKGHGIGLSLVENIISLHNGTVSVESSESGGTVFTVSLSALS